jgi:integrase
MTKPLTAAAVLRLRPIPGKRRIIRDGGARSLFLTIQPTGAKSWLMRFRRPGGTIGKLVLGTVDLSGKELTTDPEIGAPLSLSAARQLAADIHHQRARGVDVIADRKADRRRKLAEIEASGTNTFATLAHEFIAEHAMRRTRRWREAARLLGLDYKDGDTPIAIEGGLAQRWHDRPISQIDGHDLHGVIDETRRIGTPGLARHRHGLSDTQARAVFAALSKFFSWLTQQRKITTNPMTGLHKPPSAPPRDRILTDVEVVKFWKATTTVGEPWSAVLRLLLLTGCRVREIAELSRSEFSAHESAIYLPGERTKNRRPHIVALAPTAREIIESVPRMDGYMFTTNGRSPITGFGKIKKRLDAAMGNVPPWRLHDLRRTAVTGMAELGIAPHIIELCVNHVSGTRGGVAGIYNRSEMMTERRAALERWAQHVVGLVEGRVANVTPLRRSGGA